MDEFKLKTMLSNDIYIEESLINENKELLDTLKWNEFKKLLQQQDYKVKTQKNKVWIWKSNEEDRFFTSKTLKYSITYSLAKKKVS